MSEFYDLGEHCSFCKTKGSHVLPVRCINCWIDFLPFTCAYCDKVFCLEHRHMDAHNCTGRYKLTNEMPICPICNQRVPINIGEDVNIAVDRHIQEGCPKTKMRSNAVSKTRKCSKCNEKAMMRCKKCYGLFCLNHRLFEDHACPRIQKESKPTTTSNFLGTIYLQRQQEKNAKPIRRVPKGKFLESKFANKKTQPIGQSSIEYQDKFFLDVFFPLSSQVAPLHMYFSKNWKVGKVLDKIAQQGKIVNRNAIELDPKKRLNLFNLKTGVKLPTDKVLKEIPNLVSQRDPVILEYGDELPSHIKEKFARISNDLEVDDSSCIIS